MQKLQLPEVTLLGLDGLNVERLQLALDISTVEIEFGAVKLLTPLPTNDYRAIIVEPIASIKAYSKFCITNLYKYVDTPFVLVAQHDGFVLDASLWQAEFLNYDYIGAPFLLGSWAQEVQGIPKSEFSTLLVGNGGFSLRSRKLLCLTSELVDSGDIVLGVPEDWLMCYTYRALLESHGIKFAPPAVADVFSFEGRTKDNHTWKQSFGFHSLRFTDISIWLNKNPQYKNVLPNQIEISGFE